MVKTKCEVYSRVVGYIRPVGNWNDSKQAEFSDRILFDKPFKEVVKKDLGEIIVKDFKSRINNKKIIFVEIKGNSNNKGEC